MEGGQVENEAGDFAYDWYAVGGEEEEEDGEESGGGGASRSEYTPRISLMDYADLVDSSDPLQPREV